MTTMAAGCNNYKIAPENSSFSVSSHVAKADAGGVELYLNIIEGAIDGECVLSINIWKGGKAVAGYQVLANGRTRLEKDGKWQFDRNGDAMFLITGLDAGKYEMDITVDRWYHSASTKATFTVTF